MDKIGSRSSLQNATLMLFLRQNVLSILLHGFVMTYASPQAFIRTDTARPQGMLQSLLAFGSLSSH